MAKEQKGLGDDGKVHVVSGGKRGSTERHMTTKENLLATAAKKTAKKAGAAAIGALVKGLTDRRCS